MKQFATKLEITNSVNDEQRFEWNFCDTYEEAENWIAFKETEKNEWNNDRSGGVMSRRYYSFFTFNMDELLNLDLRDLEGMTLKDFINIIR